VRTVFVHDYLNQYGGAERVLEALHDLNPSAPVYTSIYASEAMPASYRQWDIHTSWMQHLPAWRRFFRHYFFLYPWLSNHLTCATTTSSSVVAVPMPKELSHGQAPSTFGYCHTPMRFAWQTDNYVARENIRGVTRSVMQFLLGFVRRWDVRR
jgi:hypothetical protein